MLRIIDYSDNTRSSRRVLCVASKMITSSNGLSCKLHNVIVGINTLCVIIFILYGLYVIDLLSLCVKIIYIDWTNAIDKEAIIRISVCY